MYTTQNDTYDLNYQNLNVNCSSGPSSSHTQAGKTGLKVQTYHFIIFRGLDCGENYVCGFYCTITEQPLPRLDTSKYTLFIKQVK